MKKRIIISLISLLLVGCSVNQPEPNENKNSEKEQVVDSSSEDVKDIVKEAIQDIQSETDKESTPEVDTTSTSSKKDYIIATFKEYGKEVDASQWILKEEGPNKTAVIIKEPRNKSKPLISKLIFKWNGASEKAEILYIMIDNNYHYGNE